MSIDNNMISCMVFPALQWMPRSREASSQHCNLRALTVCVMDLSFTCHFF